MSSSLATLVQTELDSLVQAPASLLDTTALSPPVAAISVLLRVVEQSQAETMMGLQDELQQASTLLQQKQKSLAVKSGCELFLQYCTRTALETADFRIARSRVVQRGADFLGAAVHAHARICTQATEFVRGTVLTLGWSPVTAQILYAARKKLEKIIILEGSRGTEVAQAYATTLQVPVTVVPDAAVLYCMDDVDMVLTGAEAVVENGGVVHCVGTATTAACAAACNKPVYVAVESYKFTRLYPFAQRDVVQNVQQDTKDGVTMMRPAVDLTPSKHVSLLFTDLGVLTPSAVSDELIRMYQ